jgi:serine/threonine-protein kinase
MSIDRETWTRIQPLFDRLLDLEKSERPAEIDAADLDPASRAALIALLDAHDADDDLLGESAAELLGIDEAELAGADWTGRRLGPWKVEERLAEGGMSVVHAGSRADGRFDMAVAIKVLKTERLHIAPERMNAETRILARVQHPGIARLIDSGADEDGRPYLVMERIEGTPIHSYCREKQLELRERVDLVLSIAEALEFAHQRQVVHCDIKPANVLVRADGRPCIVDFGISVLVKQDQAADPDAGRFHSPGFAAPERYENAPPDTAQDIYSLGALLAEVLIEGGVASLPDCATGRRAPTMELEPQPLPIQDGTGHLPRDLTAVLRRALAFDPGARYRSMSAFANDLRAWLDHRPVAAFEGGRAYIAGRWFRRHRLAASLGLVTALSLIGGAGIALYQAELARDEAARAVAVRDFAISLFNAADPTLEDGADPPASELLRRGADRVSEELTDQPDLAAELLHVIGAVQIMRGLIAESAVTLDRARALADEFEIDPATQAQILSERGMAAYDLGDYETAVDLQRQAHEIAVRIGMPVDERALITTRYADMSVVQEDPEPALALIDPLIEELDEGQAVARAFALRVKGAALELQGKLDEAIEQLELALDAQRAADPDNYFYATIQNEIAIVLYRQGRFAEAAEVLEDSLVQMRRIYGEAHPRTQTTIGNLANMHAALGRLDEAERAYEQALAALIDQYGDDLHPTVGYTHGMLAWTIYRQGRIEDAERQARLGLAIYHQWPEDHTLINWVPWLTGLIGLDTGQPDAIDLLGSRSEDQCLSLDDTTPLGVRLCLARIWFEVQSGTCAEGLPPSASEDLLSELPERWQAVHTAIVETCAGRPIGSIGGLPSWIRVTD